MAMVLLLAFLITPLFKGDARTFISLSFYCLVRVVSYLCGLRGTGLGELVIKGYRLGLDGCLRSEVKVFAGAHTGSPIGVGDDVVLPSSTFPTRHPQLD